MDESDDTISANSTEAQETIPVARVVAGRFEVGDRIGAGAFGVVHEAHDRLFDRKVAVKFLRKLGAEELHRFRVETATLRLLRLPGVVEIIEDGVSAAGSPWIVTDLVVGRPFPGAKRRHSWSELAEPTRGVLETLSRVHRQGILHLDMKPDNVLVDDAPRVTLLDFGISSGRGYQRTGSLAGTPAYVAPEQVNQRRRLDERADLFATGAMLYEALTGELPFSDDTLTMVMNRAYEQEVASLYDLEAEAPPNVIETIHSMLSIRPNRRPQTADEVMELFGRRPVTSPSWWIGSEAPIHQAIEMLDDGILEVTVGGGPDSGRTRFLEEVERVLHGRGDKTCRWPDIADDAVWLVDGQEIPAAGWRSHQGSILKTVTAPGADIELGALSKEEIATLFHGPELALALPSRSAAEIYRRTGGQAGAVFQEIAQWVRTGAAFWDDGKLRISHCRLTHIETTAARVAKVTRTHLSASRDLLKVPENPRADLSVLSGLDSAAVADALARGEYPLAARLATAQAESALARGVGVHAFTAAGWALPIARMCENEDLITAALNARTAAALDSSLQQMMELALYEIEQSRGSCQAADRLATLCRLVLDVWGRRGNERHEELAAELGPFEHEFLERHRQTIFARRLVASRGERADLAEQLWVWGNDPEWPDRLFHLATWIGLARHRHLQFDESADWQLAASKSPHLSVAWAALGNAVSARLDGYRLDEALELNQELAAHPLYLAPIAGLSSAVTEAEIAYRSGTLQEHPAELLELVELMGESARQGSAHLLAGAVNLRKGDFARAAEHARAGRAQFDRAGIKSAANLCAGLELASGADGASAEALFKRLAVDPLPGARLQSLALAKSRGFECPCGLEWAAADLAELGPARTDVRREVLSVHECADLLGIQLP